MFLGFNTNDTIKNEPMRFLKENKETSRHINILVVEACWNHHCTCQHVEVIEVNRFVHLETWLDAWEDQKERDYHPDCEVLMGSISKWLIQE